MNTHHLTQLKPGDDALLILTVPNVRLLAVRIARVWRSLGGTERVEVSAPTLRRGGSFDRRQFIALSALENLSDRAPLSPVAASADTGRRRQPAAVSG